MPYPRRLQRDDTPTTPAAEAPLHRLRGPPAAPAATNAQPGATGWQDYGTFTVTEDKTVTPANAHVDQTVRVALRRRRLPKMACWMVITPRTPTTPPRPSAC